MNVLSKNECFFSSLEDIENKKCVELVSSMEKKLSNLRSHSSGVCIYKVPSCIRHMNEEAYTPKLVSIGPIHHHRADLKAMENLKWRYLGWFLEETGVELSQCIKVVMKREKEVRDCYAKGSITITHHDDQMNDNGDAFVEMIVLDALFILEILLRLYDTKFMIGNEIVSLDDYYLIPFFMRDLQLLENQIPFFILQDIHEIASKQRRIEVSINELCYSFLGPYQTPQTCDKMDSILINCFHFVDLRWGIHSRHHGNLTRIAFSSSSSSSSSSSPPPSSLSLLPMSPSGLLEQWPSPGPCLHPKVVVRTISELHKSGIKLKRSEMGHLLSVSFDEDAGILKFPKIEVDLFTDNILPNMLAYERCQFDGTSVTNFCIFLHTSVKTGEDLNLLVHHGIMEGDVINNHNQVLKFIRGLNSTWDLIQYRNINGYYAHLYGEIDKWCRSKRRRCRVLWFEWNQTLKRNYFNTPWAIISIIAAAIILILTLIQTVCSLLSIKK